jgi:hypothetical protein
VYRSFSKPLKVFLLICSTPVVLAVLIVGCRLGNVLTTRPFLWSVTRTEPSPGELAGIYKISQGSAGFADGLLSGTSRLASIELHADHSAIVTYFPNTDGFGKPDSTTSNGRGTWSLEEPSLDGIRINIYGLAKADDHSPNPKPQFDSVGYGGILLGHSPPYELYFGVGDPDEGEGIIFQRIR